MRRLNSIALGQHDLETFVWIQENFDYDQWEGRTVKKDKLWNGLLVSTVYLVLDHSFGYGPPMIFETMVFDDLTFSPSGYDIACERYSTIAEARRGHEEMKKKCSSIWYTIKYWWNVCS